MYYRPQRNIPGDNAPEWARPEVVAAEQRILTFADGLLTWMRSEEWKSDRLANEISSFFTHQTEVNPASAPIGDPDADANLGVTKMWILDKMDPDANRLFMDLLRAAWERRCWKANYGETEETKRL